MAEDIGALAISLSIDSANFEQSMKSIDRNLKAMGQEMRGVQARGAEWGSSTDGLTAKQEGLSRMFETQGTKVDRLRAAYEASKTATGENSAATENLNIQLQRATAEYNRTETELAQVTAALRRQADELRLSESNWTRLGETMQAVGEKLKAVGDKMTSVGKGLSVGLTAPIVAFGAAGIAAFNDVDEAIDTVITKTGATGEAADKLTENFRTVAKRVPDDLLSVGEAIGEVNTQFGFLGTELEDASQLMLQFANINGTDVTSASIASKQAIEAYGLANSDLNSVLDSVTKTAQDTGQAVDFLFDKATAGAPQIKALGLNFAEGTALIGSFEKAGVDSSAALSSLGKATIAYAKDGKTLEVGLNGTIDSILNAKSETDALTLAAEVFGTKGAVRMVDAIKRGTFSLEEFTGAGANAAGVVVNTFNETVDPIDQAAIAMNNAKLAMSEVGEVVQVALLPFMEKMTEVLGKVADKFRELSPETKNTILVIAGIAAAIGPVLVIVGTLVSSIGSIIAAFGTASLAIGVMTTGVASAVPGVGALATVFTALTGPIGIAVAAIVGVGAALVLAYNKVEWFRDGVNAVWDKIKELTSVAFEAIKKTISTVVKSTVDFAKDILDKFKKFWDENGKAIMAIVKLNFDLIKNNIQLVMGVIKGVFEVVWPIITSIIKVAWETIKLHVKNGIDLVLGIIQTVMKLIQGDWSGAWETIKKTAKTIWDNIEGYFKNVDLVQIGKDIISGLIKGISSMVSAVGDAIKNVTSAITDTVKNILQIKSPSRVMMQIGEWTVQGFIDGLKENEDAPSKVMDDISKSVIDKTKWYADQLTTINSNMNRQIEFLAGDHRRTIVSINLSEKSDLEKLDKEYAEKGLIGTKEYESKKASIVKRWGNERAIYVKEEAMYVTGVEREYADQIRSLKEIMHVETYNALKESIDKSKKANEISALDEMRIWSQATESFVENTSQRKSSIENLADAHERALEHIKVRNEELREQEISITAEYTKAVDERAKSIMSFANTFDEFKTKQEVSGAGLMGNLQSQVDGFKSWQENIAAFSAKAIDEGLIAELKAMGPKALAELQALNAMTDAELDAYSALYQEKQAIGRVEAEKELIGLKTDTESRIQDLKNAVQAELDEVNAVWKDSSTLIVTETDAELSKLKDVGINAGQGLLDGLASMESALVAKATSIADAVKSAMEGAFDIHSPSRWMRDMIGKNMMVGWMDGMESMRSKVLAVANASTDWMTPNVPDLSAYATPQYGGGYGSNSSTTTTNNSPTIVNNYYQPINSPSELARKQTQGLRNAALDW